MTEGHSGSMSGGGEVGSVGVVQGWGVSPELSGGGKGQSARQA